VGGKGNKAEKVPFGGGSYEDKGVSRKVAAEPRRAEKSYTLWGREQKQRKQDHLKGVGCLRSEDEDALKSSRPDITGIVSAHTVNEHYSRGGKGGLMTTGQRTTGLRHPRKDSDGPTLSKIQ